MKLFLPTLPLVTSLIALSAGSAGCSKKGSAPDPAAAPVSQPGPAKPPDPAPSTNPVASDARAEAAKTPEPADVAVPAPDAAVPADPSAGGLAGGTQPASAVEVSELPALYAPLFKDEVASFVWSFEVDTHDAEAKDPVARIKATLSCRPKVSTMAEARIAKVECEVKDKEGSLDVVPTVDRVWIATRDGLWLTGSVPADPAELAEILKSRKVLSPNPSAFEDKQPGDPDRDLPPWTYRLAQDEDAWCYTAEAEGMYGVVGNTWCFAADKGLVKVEVSGREGPSTESYLRK